MIQPQYRRLIDILSGKLFRIPKYQRHYSWQKKQREDLFKDISNLERTIHIRKDAEHFMSTIVCMNSNQTECIGSDIFQYYDIVDGQQRLTTLIVLLKAISKRLSNIQGNNEAKDEASSLDRLLVKRDGKSIILQNNHDNTGILKQYLSKGEKPKQSDIKTAADKNLSNCIEDCEKFVEKYDSFGKLTEILGLIKNRLCFVFQELSDAGAAYTVFEVLNSRGLDVDWLDKCKSMLMGILYEAKITSGGFEQSLDIIHREWAQIYQHIGTQNIAGHEIVRFSAALRSEDKKGRPPSAEDAIEHFRKYCEGGSDGDEKAKRVKDSTEWIRDVTAALSNLYADKRRNAVTDILQSRLMATSIFLRKDLQEPDRNKILQAWESVTFRIYGLYGADARVKVGDFVRLSKVIIKNDKDLYCKPPQRGKTPNSFSSADEICSYISGIGKDYPVDKIPGDVARNPYEWLGPAYLRYLFYRYEEYLCHQAGSNLNESSWREIWDADANDTIEHILPQDIDGKDCWSAFNKNHTTYVHQLGNLAILSPSKNSAASNKCFDEKKDIYQKANLLLLQEITKNQNWTIKEIDERTKKLLDFIKNTWT